MPARALVERIGDPLLGREVFEVLASIMMFGGDLTRAAEYAGRSAELAEAAGDEATLVMALTDLVIVAAYAGDHVAAARHDAAAGPLAERMGSPVARGWAAYAAGERRAEAGEPGAAESLERAVSLAEEVDAAFLAGVARHTLLTAARAGDPATAPARFGRLLDLGTAWAPGPSSGSRCRRWPRRCRAAGATATPSRCWGRCGRVPSTVPIRRACRR